MKGTIQIYNNRRIDQTSVETVTRSQTARCSSVSRNPRV